MISRAEYIRFSSRWYRRRLGIAYCGNIGSSCDKNGKSSPRTRDFSGRRRRRVSTVDPLAEGPRCAGYFIMQICPYNQAVCINLNLRLRRARASTRSRRKKPRREYRSSGSREAREKPIGPIERERDDKNLNRDRRRCWGEGGNVAVVILSLRLNIQIEFTNVRKFFQLFVQSFGQLSNCPVVCSLDIFLETPRYDQSSAVNDRWQVLHRENVIVLFNFIISNNAGTDCQ